LKLANYLQVRATNVILTTVFKAGLVPYIRLATTSVKRNILIEHKKTTIVCEESGTVSLSYNDLVNTLEVNTVVKPVIPIVTIKSTLTCANYGKTSHSVETCHNKKRKLPMCQLL
jgi:hypothetical protein